jgi:hypothetical protein
LFRFDGKLLDPELDPEAGLVDVDPEPATTAPDSIASPIVPFRLLT